MAGDIRKLEKVCYPPLTWLIQLSTQLLWSTILMLVYRGPTSQLMRGKCPSVCCTKTIAGITKLFVVIFFSSLYTLQGFRLFILCIAPFNALHQLLKFHVISIE